MASRRRAVWALLDQGISSVSNFLLLILALRSSTAAEAGAFGLTYTTFFLLLMLGRAVSGDPMNVRHVSESRERWRISAGHALGAALSASLILAIGLAVVAWPFDGPMRLSLCALAIGLPALLLQDALRLCYLAAGDARAACLNDGLMLVAQIAAFGALHIFVGLSANLLLLVWAASAGVAALAGILGTGLTPAPRSTASWLRAHRDLTPAFAADYATNRGAEQGASVVTSAFAGLAALGAVTASRTLFAPATTIQTGLNSFLLPEIARLRSEGRVAGVRRIMWGLSAATAALMVLTGVAIALIPETAGQALLADNWSVAKSTLLEMTIFSVVNAIAFSAWLTMRGLGQAVAVLQLRTAFGVQLVLATALGAHWGGAPGAIWGMTIVTAGLAAATLFQAERRLHTMGVPAVESAE